MWFDNLKEKRLWQFFNSISSVPRDSGKEDKIRDYILSWAKENNIEAVVDKCGNIIMRKGATKGYENKAPIALQGHMDMVCVKREGSQHDFTKDPIEIVSDGKVIRAKDTSLGADNGIALAMILDLFSDESYEHGPLEAIMTVNEEVGLSGAFGLEGKYVKARKMINIDNEEEGFFCIGCAGGLDATAEMHVEREEVKEGEAISFELLHLNGGHSGSDINKGRLNAITAFSRFLSLLPSYRLVKINAGTKRNVIPSSIKAELVVPSAADAIETAHILEEELRVEFCKGEGNININVKAIERPEKALREDVSRKIGNALLLSPNGVQTYSQTLEGIVETSANLAIVNLSDEDVRVVFSIRSSIESAKKNVARIISTLYSSFGFTVTLGDGYPGWIPNPASPLAVALPEAYRRLTGKTPLVTAIHAGLECGIINDRIPGMDSISIGPNLFDVHSVNEHLEIESAERLLEFLKAVLKEI